MHHNILTNSLIPILISNTVCWFISPKNFMVMMDYADTNQHSTELIWNNFDGTIELQCKNTKTHWWNIYLLLILVLKCWNLLSERDSGWWRSFWKWLSQVMLLKFIPSRWAWHLGSLFLIWEKIVIFLQEFLQPHKIDYIGNWYYLIPHLLNNTRHAVSHTLRRD